MKTKYIYHLLVALLSLEEYTLLAQDSTKHYRATRTAAPPKIDGLLNDEQWMNVLSTSDFTQNTPLEGAAPTQKTEVKLIYDDDAIYVSAMLYDSSPDSIVKELGSRDANELNADKFRLVIDPYLTQQDAYDFGVYASGVQLDSRFSDETYNAVWYSAVKILSNGWSVEMKIPYAAIRFPNKKEQQWGLQFTRDVRRFREFDQWALTPLGKANPQKYWGRLEGISDIKPPIRLSLTPYFSAYYQNARVQNSDKSYSTSNSFSYNAGADIKYGINESFTVDMILLPDFGQVQSDNKIKNLSFREINYDEKRPFFKEGVDLFNKKRLFYSRRVGGQPAKYKDVEDLLTTGETIKKNPNQAKLLNAAKFSGRNNNGLGIGIFNAITDNTYAEIEKPNGETRKILTEPLTNYHALVFDQQLKNSSNMYFINTNVARKGNEYNNANVSGSGFYFQNKKSTLALEGGTNLSQIFKRNDSLIDTFTDELGYYYYAGVSKISGTWQGKLYHETASSTFKRSDMGYFTPVNYSSYRGNLSHNNFKPWKSLLRSFVNLNINYSHNYLTQLRTDFSYNIEAFILFKSFFSFYTGGVHAPLSNHDYNETRNNSRYYKTPEMGFVYSGISTDYRKKLAVDINVVAGMFPKKNSQHFPTYPYIEFTLKPRFRASNRLSFMGDFNYSVDPFNAGYVDKIKDTIIFGSRKLYTYTNTLSAKYIFKNDMSFTLNARHYWNTGEYIYFYYLKQDGILDQTSTYTKPHDFSYNSLTIDAIFSWVFTPGSLVSIAYKNIIDKEEAIIPATFMSNFTNTLQLPQTNSLSVRVLYFLDYQRLKKKSA